MADLLRFPLEDYETLTFDVNGQIVRCRAWKNLLYCTSPVDPIQRLSLYAPESCFVSGACDHTVPIFLPNRVGGYMPGPMGEPMMDEQGMPNIELRTLMHGYVVGCAGIRGRKSVQGRAPALIVDMKAVVRYLRHNADLIPGNAEKIITSGTSAGGALSALTGATGNVPDYEPYLKAIGAANERDDIFAANCYCPIIDLENADSAYEWQFCGETHYNLWGNEGDLTLEQEALSSRLKALYPAYLNSLGLKDEENRPLTLETDGTGSFLEYVKKWVILSAQSELDANGKVENAPFLTIVNGTVTAIDWPAFVHAATRMKPPPAFDALDLNSPENDEFGTADGVPRHFTVFGLKYSHRNGAMSDSEPVRLINPLKHIGHADTARHWRIRHGSHDRDTSLAVPVTLAALLRMHGCMVDFHLPWGLPHCGDYDLEDLFDWIDHL